MSRLKDIPELSRDGSNLNAVMQAVRETLQTYRGYRGDKLDRGITLRDLVDAGMVTLRPGFLNGGSEGLINPIVGPGIAIPGVYEIDLTPPPTPTGLAVDSAISNIFVECDVPLYTQGHGHAQTVVFGAKWPASDPPPTFSAAVELYRFQGTFSSYATDPATRWCIWIKWESVDGVLSTDPAGGTNGVVVTTGQDVDLLVKALTGPGNPFTILLVDTVIDEVTYPAGTYTTQSFIMDAQISRAKIKDLAVDNAKIASLSAAKLTAGAVGVGQYIQSTGFVSGSSGWRISGNGVAEFSGVIVRGAVYATEGIIGGNIIDSTGIESPDYATGAEGWRLDSSGSAEFGAASIRGQLTANQIDSRGLTIKDAAGNVILGSGNKLATSYINGLGALATQNSVRLGHNVTFPDGSVINSNDLVSNLSKINSGNIGTFMDGAAITNAYIGIAAIKTANIESLAVDTLQIAGSAVTVPAYISAQSSDVTLQYILSGEPGQAYSVFILCSLVQSYFSEIFMTINGVGYMAETPLDGTLATKGVVVSLVPGSYSIRLRSTDARNANGTSIYVLATKR